MGGQRKQRSAWEDRFGQPTESEVLSHYPRQLLGCAEGIRAAMRSRADMLESLDWMGVPWRWTFSYKRPGERTDSYLVPLPAAPRWVLTVPLESLDQLRVKQLARPVREALVHATRVGEHLWAQWDVQTKGQIAEISGLLDALLEWEPAASGA